MFKGAGLVPGGPSGAALKSKNPMILQCIGEQLIARVSMILWKKYLLLSKWYYQSPFPN
jgi:hypothetical protein